MIKTTSLELSKRLYELVPEWNDTHFTWKRLLTHETLKWKDWFLADWNNSVWDALGEQSIPAPDLDWLLDKIAQEDIGVGVRYIQKGGSTSMDLADWYGKYVAFTPDLRQKDYPVADTPADAACLLLIKLIEQGIVKV